MASFGSEFADKMSLGWYRDGAWSRPEMQPVRPLSLHPGAHVLHYASTCFDGLKAYRQADGKVRIFRLAAHVQRMRQSAARVSLPVPDEALLSAALMDLVDVNREAVPDYPGALYLRPVIIGTEPDIGAAGHASHEACLFILASPVGAYFTSGHLLRILIDETNMRSAPDFGSAKTGGNYASALYHIEAARRDLEADQVLFCPGGDVQETGAANFMLLDDGHIVTRELDGTLLHGITRDSLLQLARTMDYDVEERRLTVDEVLAWSTRAEAALSGTAAVLADIGTLICRGREHQVNGGRPGRNSQRLRDALGRIHSGQERDRFGWLTEI